MDDYIQEPVETGGFILWKNSQRADSNKKLGGMGKACRSLFVLERNETRKEEIK